MKILILLAFLLNSGGAEFELRKLKINGLDFMSTQNEVEAVFGEANKIQTDYECGFYSIEQPNAPFFQLQYSDIEFIGNDKVGYQFQSIRINIYETIEVKYDGKLLNFQTSIEQFVEIIGDDAKELLENDSRNQQITLYSKGYDDAAFFTFRNGKLLKIEYWSPC